MIVKPLSKKAINSIRNTGYLNVWEGSVRSSKTVTSELAWIKFLNESDDSVFIMSGKTIASLYKNVISGDIGLCAILGDLADYHHDTEGNRVLDITTAKGIKRCYCASGDNERSFSKIRGITAGGWYADEVSLQPQSFIEECLRRTIVSSNRKHFWTLNPENPNHYIYTEYIDKYADEELPGFYLWKFNLDDNLAISNERKEELKKQYSGIFYRRYILGERTPAEGVVYDMFDSKIHTYKERISGLVRRKSSRYIAVDYGTTNPCVFLEIFDDGDDVWVEREYSWDSKKEQRQKTDNEYVEDMKEFARDYNATIVIDPSAESFKVALSNALFYVKDADNDVLNGIRVVANLLNSRRLHVHVSCKGLIEEFSAYAWDAKASMQGIDKPIKRFDHRLDALRYVCKTMLPSWRTGIKDV